MKKISSLLLVVFLLSACKSAQSLPNTPTAIHQPIASELPSQTLLPTSVPTHNQTPTITNSLTEIPTLDIPPSLGNPGASALALSPQNAGSQMKLLDHFGTGQPEKILYTHDGKHILVGGSSGIRIYDALTFEVTGFLETNKFATKFYLSPDDTLIAIASYEDGIDIWSLINGKLLHTLEYPDGFFLNQMTFGSQGNIVVSGSRNDPVLCMDNWHCLPMLIRWNVTDPQPRDYLEGEVSYEGSPWDGPLEISPDGNTLAVGLQLYEATTLKFLNKIELPNLTEQDFMLQAEAFEDDTKLIFSIYEYSSRTDSLYIVNPIDGSKRNIKLPCGANLISSKVKTTIIRCQASDYSDEIRSVNLVTGTVSKPFDVSWSIINLALDSDGTDLALLTGFEDPNFDNMTIAFEVINAETGKKIHRIEYDNITAMDAGTLNLDGETTIYGIVTGDSAGIIRIYDAISHEPLLVLPSSGSAITKINLSPNNDLLAVVDSRGSLKLWNLQDQKLILELTEERPIFFDIPNSTLFTQSDCILHWHSLITGDTLKSYDLNCSDYHYLGDSPFALSPANQLLTFDIHSEQVRVMNVDTDKPILEIATTGEFKYFHGNALAISPDGKYLAFGGTNPEIYIWDLEKGRLARKLVGHEYIGGDGIDAQFLNLVFSPVNDLLVSVGIDGTTRLWNVETGSMLRVLNFGGFTPYCWTHFTPDGRFLVTADYGVIRLWGIPTAP